jgi:hypothetical protein
MKSSIGNKVIVEAYQKEGLKADVKNGFAMVQQKIHLKPLKVLVDACICVGNQTMMVKAGAHAFIKEESLHTQAWATKVLACDEIGVPFIIVDLAHVEFFKDGE